jgi:hypothetical protein
VRRLTYVLASGAAAAGALAWTVQQPFVDRWIVGKLDRIVRDETGLAFQADRLDIQPFRGRVTLHRVALGGDLFQARKVEVEVDPLSLLRLPHIRRILVEEPEIHVDVHRLEALHLKAHARKTKAAEWRVDRVDVPEGRIFVDEPAWGIRQGFFRFVVDGRGRLPNQLWLDVRMPQAALGTGSDRVQGNLSLKFRFTGTGIDTANLQARLGQTSVKVLGALNLDNSTVKAEVSGGTELREALAQLPGGSGRTAPAPASGFVEFKGTVQGPLATPTWNLSLEGRHLRATAAPLAPGSLAASASGGPGHIKVERLQWESPDGRIAAHGGWSRREGTSLDVDAQSISLTPVAGYARIGFLRGLTARFHGTAAFPGQPWEKFDLAKAQIQGTGKLFLGDQEVGSLDLAMKDRALRADTVEIHVPEAEFEGGGTALLDARGPVSMEARGTVRTDADEVARILRVWKVTDLDMSGDVQADAALTWTRAKGIRLKGSATVETPRWHHATADHVTANVVLNRDDIRISDIELAKGAGNGWGDIWISWAKDAPADTETIDMCFRASRLPIHEGLAAADQQDLDIQGTGSGWTRLHGSAGNLRMEGQAVAESATVYGLNVPAASGAFGMDITKGLLWTRDVRVADSLATLQPGGGSLDLTGSMDMDTQRSRWTATLNGQADSTILGLGGPRIRGQVKAALSGPLTAPLGPIQVPEGTFTLTGADVQAPGHHWTDLQASLAFQNGRLDATAGFLRSSQPVLALHALQTPGKRLAGNLSVRLEPDTMDTATLASGSSQGFLRDLALDYQAQGAWSPTGLGWEGGFEELRAEFASFKVEQAHRASVDGNLKGVDIRAELALGSREQAAGSPAPEGTSLRMEGRLPFLKTDPETLHLDGSAELGGLKAIIDHWVDPGQYSLMSDLHPSGTATFQLDLGGTRADPTLEGRLDLHNGRLAASTFPQSIENVDFTALFHGRDIEISKDRPLRGTLAQGALAAWGRVGWTFKGLRDYDLGATLEDAQFRDLPEGFEVQGSFNGTLRGSDRDGGLLKGAIHAKHMAYQAEISLTDIVLSSAFGGGSGMLSMDPTDPLARIELDLDLGLARPWEVETNLLKFQGNTNGAFKIMGTLAHPGLKGRMDLLPGGRLTNVIPAGDVVLERGSITFQDPATFNPAISLTGRVEVDPYLVNLEISGLLDAPQCRPTSTPSLSPDEIFLILMDPSAVNMAKVGSSDITVGQTAAASGGLAHQGASLLTSLALASGLEALRKTLRLDRVNFAYTGTQNMTLTLQKTLDPFGHRIPIIGTMKQEGTQTTVAGNLEFRFGNLVLTLGAKQVSNSNSTPGESVIQGVQPSGEIRYTWSPR